MRLEVTGQNTDSAPLIPDVGIVALVPERWGGMWLSRHQILTRLSSYFHVVWQNPARPWRRILKSRPPRNVDPTKPPRTGFAIYEPGRWLPRVDRSGRVALALERRRLMQARRMLEDAGCRKIVLYLWLPDFAAALDLMPHDVSCYHIVDEYTFSETEQPVSVQERNLIERADQVIVHSPALREKKGNLNPHTAFMTNGVDYAAFAEPLAEPADLAAIPRPRIGYVGRVKSQMDWQTLTAIARSRPDWSLVFVGPVGHMGKWEDERIQLFGLPNVHHLGNKSVGEVPAYIQHMDVCLLCYALTGYTKFIFPLKLHEYLAAGRPVVGSDIRSLHDFSSVVRIAHGAEDWCAAIEASLQPEENSPARMEERRRVARQYDWNAITHQVAGLLCERLGPEYQRTFEGIHFPDAPAETGARTQDQRKVSK